MKKSDKLRNRADDEDRPHKTMECRKAHPPNRGDACFAEEPGLHNHEYVFRPGDNYGCCKRCGDEILT